MNQTTALSSFVELKEQLEAQISRFNERRVTTGKWRNCLYVSQVLVSAITTVIIAANIHLGLSWLNIVATFGNVLATTLGVLLTRYMFHERLATYTQTSAKLQTLAGKIKLLECQHQDDPTAFPLDAATAGNLFDQMQMILSNANQEWTKMMKGNKPEQPKDAFSKNSNH
ncbi:SLATT domain-containing protein [Acidithiobacillus ferriphilus]|jgi:hypothetical protein|uniref:SLATT domain-containing protein n=1 Tax=Acidithiobacillus ferriphilus TaxID=1689834 RepID=UPI002DB84B92|nr:SLATT domain-containing protein [Acidithiobacillus ferriphilus]MEB8534634.1 SLATT domain-containing protein [Acidithiobacillus ferriphilus]